MVHSIFQIKWCNQYRSLIVECKYKSENSCPFTLLFLYQASLSARPPMYWPCYYIERKVDDYITLSYMVESQSVEYPAFMNNQLHALLDFPSCSLKINTGSTSYTNTLLTDHSYRCFQLKPFATRIARRICQDIHCHLSRQSNRMGLVAL